ncbi:class I SAM-dependent methyltransferase [Paenibacillus sp. SYP-B3998]|uniref:Class I SAM-dependent methyltransferase n=1 Tax=Paenibacillus sp. SYP-B3998 TaxID=2678564 RepID=A0A6G4A5X6_9BACL|nr:class I SAM-dependent methyltransferase [Paenibacillus sp. SYP-B3998]NEW09047.1 class I SAM-dependent methyltransferase [Paenibacillus sp. SYP-B3998]
MTTFDITDWSSWDQVWQQTHKQHGDQAITMWDSRAQSFAGNALGNAGKRRTEHVIGWLDQLGVRFEDATVLDIGSGPGAFAVPFALRSAQVTAVEPSSSMIELLHQHAHSHGVTIDAIEALLEDINVDHEGWNQAFDLVFASMIPAISSWQYLEKALKCARKYCFLSTFAGKREHNLIRELWPLLMGGEQPAMRLDIVYMLNLLYARQYQFDFRVFEEKREDTMEPEQALAYIMQLLPGFRIPIHTDTKQKVQSYIAETYPNVVPIRTATRFGQILVTL